MKKQLLILGAVVIGIIIIFVLFKSSSPSEQGNDTTGEMGDIVSPLDVTLDFYEAWHDAIESTSTDPFAENLPADAALTEAVSTMLLNAGSERAEGEIDPVLCQFEVPEKLRAKVIHESESEAQVLVIAGGKPKLAGQALVTLTLGSVGWKISEIACTYGESAPVGEFSFDREGSLLKSVPPPLNTDYWHLIFEENGVMGHAVPLFFDQNSMCTSLEGVESVCAPERFMETASALIQGQMTEAGVQVQKLKMLP